MKPLFSSASEEWATPQALYDQLDAEFHFNLDPCATEENHKCQRYFTKQDDGLERDWSGARVFMNPPYGRGKIEPWMKKLATERVEIGVALVPARIDTRWWWNWVDPYASEIRMIKGRVNFVGSSDNGSTFPSILVVMRHPIRSRG